MDATDEEPAARTQTVRHPWASSVALTPGHVTALLALGALALYVVGVVRTVGVLHAEGVETLRGIPLVPLQDYLLRGLGVLASPTTAAALVALVALAALLVARQPPERGLLEVRAPRAAQTGSKRADAAVRAFAILMLLFFSLFMPFSSWVPVYAAFAVAAIGGLFFGVQAPDPRTLVIQHPQELAAMLVGGVLTAALLTAYLWPPPMDRATIRTTDGAHRVGKLIANGDGVAYVLAAASHDRHPAVYAIPFARIVSLRIVNGPPHRDRTLANVLGLSTWQLDPD